MGYLRQEEVNRSFWSMFATLVDANHDGLVSVEELQCLLGATSNRPVEAAVAEKMIRKASREEPHDQATVSELATMFADPSVELVRLEVDPLTQRKV